MVLLEPQLRAFEAVVSEGTVHGAAALLHLTQTAITQRIRLLEQKMKTTLFVRSRRGMLLTPEGEVLHRYCQRVVEMGGAALATIQGAGKESTIRVKIAGPTSIMRSRIIPRCESVMKAFPHLLLSFIIDDSNDISKRLKSGEIDLVILRPELVTSEMEHKTLLPESYVLLCSSQWGGRTLKDIIENERIIDFDADDPMTFAYLKEFSLLDNIQPDRHFVNNTESIAELFIAGLGYGILTEEFARPYVMSRQLILLNKKKTFKHDLTLAWYSRPEPPKYFAALINAID
ncbi:MAG: LysR family transcriptional regulator [Gammaproteobacteria bacterium]|nr:LysR family transcriptional regulator [Gammaproteobacteria bacterium]